jgi:ABC-type dipeptide/oligopeptide/nickel transport system ATPase subunit
MGTLFRTVIKKILVFGFVLVLFGCGISGKSTIQRNEAGINEAYLGCLMFDNDNNSIQKCSDLRWGSEQALYNNVKTPSNITVKDLKRATPSNTD